MRIFCWFCNKYTLFFFNRVFRMECSECGHLRGEHPLEDDNGNKK